MKNSVYLFVLFLSALNASSVFAAWKNLVTCDNGISIFIDTKVTNKTLYKADIRNKNILKNLGATNSSASLELFETSFYPPQSRNLSFFTKNQSRELNVVRLDHGRLYELEVKITQKITCAQEACTSGCYAGDTPVWDCVDLRVTPESTLYKETAYCRIE